MHKGVTLKGPLVLWLSALLSFNFHRSGDFYPNEKNKIVMVSFNQNKIRFRNQTKGICSTVHQTRGLFCDTRQWFIFWLVLRTSVFLGGV